jgi:thymidylate kinase
MADTNDNKLYKSLVGRLILRLKPRSIVFFLDINEKVALQRKRDIPNIIYAARRRKSYHLISIGLEIPTVDAERPFDDVQRDIAKQIEKARISGH